MKKNAVMFFVSFLLFSCFPFENPVDPNSPNYVGFSVETGVTLSEFSLNDYGELFYPTLSWTQIPGSAYYLQMSRNSDFSYSSDDYQGVFSYHQLMKSDTFTLSQGWFVLYDSLYLDRLGAGIYYVRVSVSNDATGNRFCTWSRSSVFNQKLKQIKAGWEDGSRYSVYSYTNDGLYKKEDSYYLFSSSNQDETEIRYLETIVYGYRDDGSLRFEFVYRDPKALSSQYSFHYYYDIKNYTESDSAKYTRINCYYVNDISTPETSDRTALRESELRYYQNGKIKNIEYYSLIPNSQPTDEPAVDEIEFINRYFYVAKERIYNYDASGKTVSIRENRYKYNEEDPSQKETTNYYIFRVSNNSIYRGEYYSSADATAYVYAYDVLYYDEDNQYPAKAVYTYSDGSEGVPYVYEYNFTTTGETESGNSDTEIVISEKKTVRLQNSSELYGTPEIPTTGFVF